MAEVSRRVCRETGRLVGLTKRSNPELSLIDGKLRTGALVEGALLNGPRRLRAVNTTQLDENEMTRGECRKCHLPQSDRVTRESLRERRNCTGDFKRHILVEEKCTRLSENNTVLLNGGFSHVSGLDMEVSLKNLSKFTDNILDVPDCQVAAVNDVNDIYAWFDSQDISMTESQYPKSEHPDFRRMPSDISSQKQFRLHKISCLKKNAYLASVTHLTNRHQQRGLCTVLNMSEMQWNYFVQPGCSGAMSVVRSYSWHGQNESSTVPPLYRSRTTYYDILQVSPKATQAQIKTAYYKQSFMYHPDKNSGSEEATQRFAEISEAYTVLGSIALRKKYDRGILSLADVQGAGKPSGREARSSSPTAHQQKRTRYTHANAMGDKKIFDFDAFYRAHYGEQLQREREQRLRREKLREEQHKVKKKGKFDKMTELSVLMMMALALYIFTSM